MPPIVLSQTKPNWLERSCCGSAKCMCASCRPSSAALSACGAGWWTAHRQPAAALPAQVAPSTQPTALPSWQVRSTAGALPWLARQWSRTAQYHAQPSTATSTSTLASRRQLQDQERSREGTGRRTLVATPTQVKVFHDDEAAAAPQRAAARRRGQRAVVEDLWHPDGLGGCRRRAWVGSRARAPWCSLAQGRCHTSGQESSGWGQAAGTRAPCGAPDTCPARAARWPGWLPHAAHDALAPAPTMHGPQPLCLAAEHGLGVPPHRRLDKQLAPAGGVVDVG